MADFGKERAKKIFYWISLLYPVLYTVWNFLISHSRFGNSLSFNIKCYGQHDQSFLLEDSVASVAKIPFCAYDEFDEEGILGVYGPVVYQGVCIFSFLFNLCLLCNIPDAFIYWRIMVHINKYVQKLLGCSHSLY